MPDTIAHTQRGGGEGAQNAVIAGYLVPREAPSGVIAGLYEPREGCPSGVIARALVPRGGGGGSPNGVIA